MTGDESETGNEVRAKARVSSNKAVRSSVVEVLTSKAAGSSTDMMIGDPSEEPASRTKRDKTQRPKKEKSPEEVKQQQFSKDCEKTLKCSSSCLAFTVNTFCHQGVVFQKP